MSKESRDRQGIERGGELLRPYSDEVTIVGLDITADALKALYEGTKRHAWVCNVIDGLVQLQRTKDGAPTWMIDGMADGVNPPPIALVDLNLDKDGKNWTALVDGRQRTMSRREEDVKHAVAGGKPSDRRQLVAVNVTFPATRTYEAVVMYTVTSNLRVARTTSSRAEDAYKLRNDGNGKSLEALVPLCEAHDTQEVECLLALHECEQEVKDAVNTSNGKVPLAWALVAKTLDADEQRRRVIRMLAGGNGAAKNAAAPARAKTQRAEKLRELEVNARAVAESRKGQEWLDDLDPNGRAGFEAAFLARFAEGLAWIQGKGDAPAWLTKANEDGPRIRVESEVET